MNSTMQNAQDGIDLGDLIAVVRRNWKLCAGVFVVTLGIFAVAALTLPKKFKSSATISIFTKYFQNPLVKDFIPEVYDASELRAQRESIIAQSFTPEYLDSLSAKYHLYETEDRAQARQKIAARIETFSTQTTTFQVSFTAARPEIAHDVMNDILNQITHTLIDYRKRNLMQIRDSIRKRVETIALETNTSEDVLASTRPELLNAELHRLEAQLATLKTRYTEHHPSVVKLQTKISLLRQWQKSGSSAQTTPSGEKTMTPDEDPALVGGEPKDLTLQVYADLLKKLNYLNIILDMDSSSENQSTYVSVSQYPTTPDSPVFPKTGLFLVWGVLTALLLSASAIVLREFNTTGRKSNAELAREMNIAYLGELPKMEWSEKKIGHEDAWN